MFLKTGSTVILAHNHNHEETFKNDQRKQSFTLIWISDSSSFENFYKYLEAWDLYISIWLVAAVWKAEKETAGSNEGRH